MRDDEWLTVHLAAKRLGIRREQTVYDWCSRAAEGDPKSPLRGAVKQGFDGRWSIKAARIEFLAGDTRRNWRRREYYPFPDLEEDQELALLEGELPEGA